MMVCDKVRSLVYDCISGELDTQEERELRRHLKSCPGCRGHYREIEFISQVIKRTEATHPSPAVCLETLRKLEGRGRFKIPVPILRPAYAVAAALILVAAAALVYHLRPGRQIGIDGRASTIAHRPLADANMDRLWSEYLDESDFVFTMVIDIGAGKAPYTMDDVKNRIAEKDLRYAGSVLFATRAGKQQICEEINSVLRDIMGFKTGEDGKQARLMALSIKRSRLIERIAEER